jgi:hypothetical protein
MKKIFLAITILFLASAAFGQITYPPVTLSGSITIGDCVKILNIGKLADAGGPCVTNFFGNTGNITALVDPTTITDAAGNTITFSAGTGGNNLISFSDGAEICTLTLAGGGTINCTDDAGDSLSLSDGTASLADSGGDSVILTAGSVALGVTGGGSCNVAAGGVLNCGGSITGSNSTLTGTSGSIGGSLLAAGACSSGTVSVTSSTTAMAVIVTPVGYPGDSTFWKGYVSTAGTVTVKVCESVAGTPTATTYNVRVIQ